MTFKNVCQNIKNCLTVSYKCIWKFKKVKLIVLVINVNENIK